LKVKAGKVGVKTNRVGHKKVGKNKVGKDRSRCVLDCVLIVKKIINKDLYERFPF
jgi:hypothetical protein